MIEAVRVVARHEYIAVHRQQYLQTRKVNSHVAAVRLTTTIAAL